MHNNLSSKHFKLEKVKEGIYAAIAKDGGGAVANAGFIDLGDKTIVFDTFNTQQAAEDLKNIAETITGRTVTWVVNSHLHGDHIRGNQVYKSCNIISTELTYEKMKEIHPARIQKQKDDIEGLRGYIQSLEKQPVDKKVVTQISFLREIEASLPGLELVLPNYTFKTEFTLHGTERTAKLISLGGGHSSSDTFLYIPEDKIAFMGDLLFVDSHPTFFDDSNPSDWYNILNEIKKMEIEIMVPGHGEIGTQQNLVKVQEYITDLLAIVRSEDNIDEIQIPDKYINWTVGEVFKSNLKTLRKLQS